MSDHVDQLVDRVAAELTAVRWADPERLRATARRRTLRTVLAVPVVLVVLVAGVWTAAGTGPGAPVPDVAASATGPVVTASPSPTAAPSPAPSAATPSGDPSPLLIPVEALLQAEDVGSDAIIENQLVFSPGEQGLILGDDTCPAYGGLKIVASLRYTAMRTHTVVTGDPRDADSDRVFVDTRRYTAKDAAQVLADARRFVRACRSYRAGTEANTDLNPAHAEASWSVLAEGFAGDESVLVRRRYVSVLDSTGESAGQGGTALYALIRMRDVITVLYLEKDQPERLEALSAKAAARLCVMVPRCR
ncbi:hypothetical protein [Catellatospora citrea]|uniref:Uncharacterized protein n=1 Tax=Catellatospora citrea TaxID=53366 RepID=A0A8J3KQR6_9ACTN|nr:hypothetical protein [Catellatospora citrea]RKE09212.1 hypothetical protein C8E86_4095 [Catellatospora citrea]GIF99609.1 hypothetical protein Cci01nite_47030 [Catellatospora citrea]